MLQEQPPSVRLATSYCLCDLKRSKSNRSASMVTLYKLENLQMGVFSEVRQNICQSPELSVLTSVTNNHPSCAAPQGCESRCPRAPVKGRPLFYSDRDRNARWPIPSSLSDIPRAPSQFVDLFQASQIEFVVDVRHIPRSRTNPQFNREILPEELATVQIGYAHVAALGGLRNRSRVDVSPNLFWDNLAFRGGSRRRWP